MNHLFTCSLSQYTPGALQVQLDQPLGIFNTPNIILSSQRFREVQKTYFQDSAYKRYTVIFEEVWTARKVAIVWLKFNEKVLPEAVKKVEGVDVVIRLTEATKDQEVTVTVEERSSLFERLRGISSWTEESRTPSSIQFAFKAKPFPRWSDVLTAVLKLLKLK